MDPLQFAGKLLGPHTGPGGILVSDVSASLALSEVIDYERFYLAEHHLYGSDRLGLKVYWPGQYRYEWGVDNTLEQNQELFDESELAYRRPWYSRELSGLMKPEETTAKGSNAWTLKTYSERLLGQKHYELNNHLGNVQVVITDKIGEKAKVGDSPGQTLPTLADKYAVIWAAYDYYPFGMQMPERVFEDETSQCAPVSSNHWVTVLTPIYNGQTSVGTFTDSFDPVEGTTVTGSTDPGGPKVEGTAGSGFTPGMKQTLQSSMGTGASFSYKAMVEGYGTFSLVYTPQGGKPLVLYSEDMSKGYVGYTGQVDGKAGSGISGSLEALYEGNKEGSSIVVSGLYYASEESEASESFVVLQCDDDDNEFSLRHRFGFNGQHKDDEIAGPGNFEEFKFRTYDCRLGRFTSRDPLALQYPWNSAYAFAENRPIDGIDLEGSKFRKAPGMFAVNALSGKTELSKSSSEGIEIVAVMGRLPAFYTKTIGVKTQEHFAAVLEGEEDRLKTNGLSTPSAAVTDGKAGVENTAEIILETIAEHTSEGKAFNEVEQQGGEMMGALNLVGAAYKNGYIPNQFAQDAKFKADLTNYIFDGTMPTSGYGPAFDSYNDVVSTLGNYLYDNAYAVSTSKNSPSGVFDQIPRTKGLDNFNLGSIYIRKGQTPLQQSLMRYEQNKGKGTVGQQKMTNAQ